MSKYRLSILTGLSKMTVHNIAEGITEPTVPKFNSIVKALNISDSDLLKFIKEN